MYPHSWPRLIFVVYSINTDVSTFVARLIFVVYSQHVDSSLYTDVSTFLAQAYICCSYKKCGFLYIYRGIHISYTYNKLIAWAKNVDTSVYREESTFR